MWLLLAFVAVPMIEIALFIQLGGFIGLGWTLLIVLATAVLGTWLVRSQGTMALNNLRRSFNELRDPSESLADAAMILVAGVLLLTPGFFTDAVGFALLTPPVRHLVYIWLRRNVKMASFTMGSGDMSRQSYPREDVIDGTYHEVETTKKPTHSPSGWRQH
jgi:UPF0716 protein FxsA